MSWMDEKKVDVTIRVPGHWEEPRELLESLSEGYRLDGNGYDLWLWLPDGGRASLRAAPPDEQFFKMWLEGCTREPTETEIAGVQSYATSVHLTMPGGNLRRAREAIAVAAELIRAGGYGVFVDNSGIAHGALDWLDLADDCGEDGGGPFWAFVNTYGDDDTLWTHGMHVLGYRDADMPRSGRDPRAEAKDDFAIRNFLGYAYRSGKRISDGEGVGDELGPTHVVRLVDDTRVEAPHAMHNPFGRFVLESVPRSERASEN
jgi:hypothetical protein